MNETKEVRFPSWKDFKSGFQFNLLREGASRIEDEKFVFRGQSCSTWDLTSSFDRLYDAETLKDREKIFEGFLNTFKTECLRMGYILKQDDEDSIAAKAQHFGMPTRLMDWSYSPYIAAYFAYSDFSTNDTKGSGEVAIWAMDRKAVEERVHINELGFVELYESKNERMVAQAGLFTRLFSSHVSVNLFLEENYSSESESPLLIKFIIPSADAEEAMYDLSLMGISSKSLFPGIEGVARYATVKSLLSRS